MYESLLEIVDTMDKIILGNKIAYEEIQYPSYAFSIMEIIRPVHMRLELSIPEKIKMYFKLIDDRIIQENGLPKKIGVYDYTCESIILKSKSFIFNYPKKRRDKEYIVLYPPIFNDYLYSCSGLKSFIWCWGPAKNYEKFKRLYETTGTYQADDIDDIFSECEFTPVIIDGIEDYSMYESLYEEQLKKKNILYYVQQVKVMNPVEKATGDALGISTFPQKITLEKLKNFEL